MQKAKKRSEIIIISRNLKKSCSFQIFGNHEPWLIIAEHSKVQETKFFSENIRTTFSDSSNTLKKR